uniref:Hexosyltransferase n=1 Tax=Pelagomonas calceolata TaxID=35677 RepID=A0A7S4E3N3_9STRA
MRRILAKTALLAVLAAGKDPPIPPWMRAILDSRPNFRGSVHRSQYPEDLELKAAGALLAKPPIRNPVVVAMTTTPTRVAACEPAVRSLLNQSQPALIIVSIPDVYNKRRSHWNGKRIEPPPWLARLDAAARSTKGPCAPCVVVAHPARDYGPATKLVGAVEALRRDPELLEKAGGDREDAVVVAADDDHEWEPFALATLLHVGFSSSSAPVGYDAAKTVWTYYSYPFPRGRPVTDAVCVAQAGDMLAAPLSLFAELERWGRELLPGGGLPSCFFVDDLFFAAYAAYHRSTVYTHPWRRWLFREARRPRPISPFRSRRWRRRLDAVAARPSEGLRVSRRRSTQSKRRQRTGEPAFKPCAQGGCSPKTMQLRYPDGLAMGGVRERHSQNCRSELEALGWWTRGAEGNPCLLGDFVSA